MKRSYCGVCQIFIDYFAKILYDCNVNNDGPNLMKLLRFLCISITLFVGFMCITAFNHLRIRLGGSLQDQVVYGVDNVDPCLPFMTVSNGLFGFSNGCLSMERWGKLNDLFQRTG